MYENMNERWSYLEYFNGKFPVIITGSMFYILLKTSVLIFQDIPWPIECQI